MAILMLTSAGGSPGVTTLAIGLALTWPRPVLLADCDPGAHQAVLAGYLRGQSSSGKGLLRVAEAHRDRRPLREVVIDQSLPLTGAEDGDRRLFLPGFTKPGSASHFGAVWEDLADTFDRLGDVDIDVIVDAGRIGSIGLPTPLVERGALTALVLGSSLRAVMSARVHLPTITDHSRLSSSAHHPFGLVVVGEGQPYAGGEISKALGVPVVTTVARDPQAAAHLSDGQTRPRRFDSSALVRSLRSAATSLAANLQRSTELVRS